MKRKETERWNAENWRSEEMQGRNRMKEQKESISERRDTVCCPTEKKNRKRKKRQTVRETGESVCGMHEGGEKKWKDDKEMAQHLRLEAILNVPPFLPLTLIMTAF